MRPREPVPVTAPRVRITGQHRRLRLAGTRASVGVRTTLLPRRPRATVCGAARLLTVAGVRVRVVPAATPWPRAGGVLAVGELGRIGRLAVLTAVPRTVGGWTELAERTLGGGRRTTAPAAGNADVLLPVAVRY